MENKHKHLEMIQNVISRMANNSFLLKSWSVVLVSALFALAAQDAIVAFVWLAYFPALTFWALDAYYLRQEKLYRSHYNYVKDLPEDKIDFSMDASGHDENVASLWGVFRSQTLLIFHGMIISSILVVMILIPK